MTWVYIAIGALAVGSNVAAYFTGKADGMRIVLAGWEASHAQIFAAWEASLHRTHAAWKEDAESILASWRSTLAPSADTTRKETGK